MLGKDELGTATERERSLLRRLTPLAKLYTAKQAYGIQASQRLNDQKIDQKDPVVNILLIFTSYNNADFNANVEVYYAWRSYHNCKY
ncbi:MAG: hypothetical protein LEGION0403_FIIPPAGN_01736 [Legionella sp.]|uniref:hypothetical protein n=1 Tax=Legionella sp. TaxID=459 RepID=UPI003D110367